MALPSTRIYDRNGKLLYEILADSQTSGRNTAIPLSSIPKACQQAVISTEDANFYSHPGVDVVGIARALWINLRGGEVIAGGSTITQQVARNLLLDPQQRAQRTIQRKLRESILALELQNAYSKDKLLALYLNQSYFGNLAYGVEAAARAYFGKSAPDLSLSGVRAAGRAAAIPGDLRSADQPQGGDRPAGRSPRPDGARRRNHPGAGRSRQEGRTAIRGQPLPD